MFFARVLYVYSVLIRMKFLQYVTDVLNLRNWQTFRELNVQAKKTITVQKDGSRVINVDAVRRWDCVKAMQTYVNTLDLKETVVPNIYVKVYAAKQVIADNTERNVEGARDGQASTS